MLCCAWMVLSFQLTYAQTFTKDSTLLQPIEIKTVRAADNMPIAQKTLSKKEIEQKNIGYDLPFILNQTPSVQVNSDAGNGIGYTGIRIRGTDASRINITLNGIPYNDPESQGTFLVNLPDFASSANSIQVQRGIGTSTNGSGAFGGAIHINTNDIDTKQYISFNNTYGSYRSTKNTLMANSGLLNKHVILTGRLSNISSDGYIDRSQSKLQSYYTSAVYVDQRQSLRLNIFSGKEKTQAAWFGINPTTLDTNRTYNPAGTAKPGSPYDNETDNYTQTHYQLFYNRKINNNIQYNIACFLIKGKGYFEQYKANQNFADYHLPNYISGNDTTFTSDIIRDLWLDNHFYGSIFSVQYNNKKTNLIIGGNISNYDGKHYGEIVHAAIQANVPANFRWYDVDANKKDFSAYAKWTQQLNNHWQTFTDFQVRNVNYQINGFENNPLLLVNKKYVFFNPKAGITYLQKKWQAYFSFGKATKEPNRDDFETNTTDGPSPETLQDFEIGFKKRNKQNSWECNLYYMRYKNQLVLTGKVNDVYAYTRTNIANSYRAGIELQGNLKINSWCHANGNITLSTNKVKNFIEYLDAYDADAAYLGQETMPYNNTDISFSPAVIAAANVIIEPVNNFAIELSSKYVGKQYMDNTSKSERMIPNYFTEDLKINYNKSINKTKVINCFLQANNIFSTKYVANGWSYSYLYDKSLTTENYYFPMATINFMAGVGITF